MDYPDRKPRPKRGSRDVEDGRKEPELRLAEYTAPRGEEFPWRTFSRELPELEDAHRALKPKHGRMH